MVEQMTNGEIMQDIGLFIANDIFETRELSPIPDSVKGSAIESNPDFDKELSAEQFSIRLLVWADAIENQGHPFWGEASQTFAHLISQIARKELDALLQRAGEETSVGNGFSIWTMREKYAPDQMNFLYFGFDETDFDDDDNEIPRDDYVSPIISTCLFAWRGTLASGYREIPTHIPRLIQEAAQGNLRGGKIKRPSSAGSGCGILVAACLAGLSSACSIYFG